MNTINLGFKIPEYSSIDNLFPVKHQLIEKDCVTPLGSSDIENASTLISTLTDGFMNAKVVNPSIGKQYHFCLKVSTQFNSIKVPNL